MANRIFIRLDSTSEKVGWLKLVGPELAGAVTGFGELSDAAATAEGCEVIVLAPTEQILLARVLVPGQKRRYLSQVVPYALEEQLIDDVEDSHFAMGRIDGDHVHVAVVDQALMQQWQGRFLAAGLNVRSVVPEVLLLPLETDAWHVMIEKGHAQIRNGRQAGVTLDVANLSVCLPLLLDEVEGSKPQRLVVHNFDEAEPQIDVPEGMTLELGRPARAPQALLAANYDAAVINLLQGDYSARERASKAWRPWRPALGMAAAWLLLVGGVMIADQQRLTGELEMVKAEIKDVYRGAFPDAKNIPKPKEMMQRQLDALRGGGAADGDANFMALLLRAGEHFNANTSVELERVNYKDGRLEVSLAIGDLQQLDQLKQKLVSEGGLTVDIQSASSQGKNVEARLKITGGAS